MTEVIFHTGVADPVAHVVRLCLKAYKQTQPLVIWCNDPFQLERVSQSIWNHEATSFVPHCFWSDPALMRQRSRLVLTDHPHRDGLPTQSIVHLGPEVPEGFASFERLVEIVGTSPESVQEGRKKWRSLQHKGYPMQHVNIPPAH